MASTSIPEPPAQRRRDWLDLPHELTATILRRLGAIEILENAQKVCTTWRNVCKDPAMWSTVDMRNAGDLGYASADLVKMAMHAVDRSCGQLVDINIEHFGGDDLLKHIGNSSSQLRHLRLAYCDDRFSSGAFIEAFKNLPLLEDIHIYYTSISKEAIEVAGRCCPMLKSFKLNKQAYRFPPAECDDEALAIAENMPGIRCLQLIGNMLTNSGLQAILDRCHCLESLDLRQCLNVNIGGDIRKICAERIKELRSPYDSMEDYPFAAVIWGACYDGHEDWLELVDVDFFDNYDYDDMVLYG